jgi:hypothetical protein
MSLYAASVDSLSQPNALCQSSCARCNCLLEFPAYVQLVACPQCSTTFTPARIIPTHQPPPMQYNMIAQPVYPAIRVQSSSKSRKNSKRSRPGSRDWETSSDDDSIEELKPSHKKKKGSNTSKSSKSKSKTSQAHLPTNALIIVC